MCRQICHAVLITDLVLGLLVFYTGCHYWQWDCTVVCTTVSFFTLWPASEKYRIYPTASYLHSTWLNYIVHTLTLCPGCLWEKQPDNVHFKLYADAISWRVYRIHTSCACSYVTFVVFQHIGLVNKTPLPVQYGNSNVRQLAVDFLSMVELAVACTQTMWYGKKTSHCSYSVTVCRSNHCVHMFCSSIEQVRGKFERKLSCWMQTLAKLASQS